MAHHYLDSMRGYKSRLIVVHHFSAFSTITDEFVSTEDARNTGEELVQLGWAVEVMNTEDTTMYRINDTTCIVSE